MFGPINCGLEELLSEKSVITFSAGGLKIARMENEHDSFEND